MFDEMNSKENVDILFSEIKHQKNQQYTKYMDAKVEEVIELETQIEENESLLKRKTFIRRSLLAAGILTSLFVSKNIFIDKNPNEVDFFLGLGSTVLLGLYYKKHKKNKEIDYDMQRLKENLIFEEECLDLEGITKLQLLRDNKKKKKFMI